MRLDLREDMDRDTVGAALATRHDWHQERGEVSRAQFIRLASYDKINHQAAPSLVAPLVMLRGGERADNFSRSSLKRSRDFGQIFDPIGRFLPHPGRDGF